MSAKSPLVATVGVLASIAVVAYLSLYWLQHARNEDYCLRTTAYAEPGSDYRYSTVHVSPWSLKAYCRWEGIPKLGVPAVTVSIEELKRPHDTERAMRLEAEERDAGLCAMSSPEKTERLKKIDESLAWLEEKGKETERSNASESAKLVLSQMDERAREQLEHDRTVIGSCSEPAT